MISVVVWRSEVLFLAVPGDSAVDVVVGERPSRCGADQSSIVERSPDGTAHAGGIPRLHEEVEGEDLVQLVRGEVGTQRIEVLGTQTSPTK